MTEEHRVTIRLDAVLYAQLAACRASGQPLAAIVRQTLVDYLDRQPDTPQRAAEVTTTRAAMAARDRPPPADRGAMEPDPLLAQIRLWQHEGMSLRKIAAKLNADGVPTRSGQGQWYQSNLSRMLARMTTG